MVNQFIKYGAVAVLVPVLAIREALDVLKAANIEIPDPDAVLKEIKDELQRDNKES